MDYFCVAETPYLPGPSGSLTNHSGWQKEVERVILTAFDKEKVKHEASGSLKLRGCYTYAIKCSNNNSAIWEKPGSIYINNCSPILRQEILNLSPPDKPIMIFAMGPAVLKSLGMDFKKYSKEQHKFIETELEGRRLLVFPSLSKRQFAAKSGFFEVVLSHISLFLDAVYRSKKGEVVAAVEDHSLLTKDYIFPKNVSEVKKLIEMIINYAPPGKDPRGWPIALDTETNTRFAHRDKLKLLGISVAWDDRKAAFIPLEHPETPWTLAEVSPYIQQLLICDKWKVNHNIKFDLKVLQKKGWTTRRIRWDTMLAEHLLSEDKKGFYSLKTLVDLYLPAYAGYEDEVGKRLNIIEEETQIAQHKKEVKLKGAAKKMDEDDGFLSIPLKDLATYGAIDADVTRQLTKIQQAKMQKEQDELFKKRDKFKGNFSFRNIAAAGTSDPSPLRSILWNRSLPSTEVLARMELRGIKVDQKYVSDLCDEMDVTLRDLKQQLNVMIPPHVLKEFNPNSAPQIRELLFGTGFLHPETKEPICYKGKVEPSKTKTGLVSTDAKLLRSLVTQQKCPFSSVLLEHRALVKARSTFLENIKALSVEDGRLHTTYNLHGTSTGRTSSADENMQNIPKKIGKHNIKKIFVPDDPENEVFFNIDAKAAEVRVYAAYSGDKNLIKALNDGMDPHSFFSGVVLNPDTVLKGVAAEDRRVTLETVGIDDIHAWTYEDFEKRAFYAGTKKNPGPDVWYGERLELLRKNIKRVVFGILYGAGKFKIADIAGIPEAQAQTIIEILFRMFPTIQQYIKTTQDQVSYIGVVETFLGRRRRFNLSGMTSRMRNQADRQAVNFKIQSTAAEIVLDVLNALEAPLLSELSGYLLLTVHDSIGGGLPKKHISQIEDFVYEHCQKRVAEWYPWLPVPFKWDVEIGTSYGELKSVADYKKDNPDVVTKPDLEDLIELEIRNEFSEEETIS